MLKCIIQLLYIIYFAFPISVTEAITKLLNSDADSVRSITESPITPFKMWLLNGNNNDAMEPLLKLQHIEEPYNQPRQKLPTVFWQTGTLDIIKTAAITEQHSMSGKKILPYLIEKKYAIDIDDVASFYKAEELIQNSDCIKFDE